MTHLLLTVRFLDDRYHGLLDRGGPVEWPPSPFRLFQALVAGVARRGELVVGEDVPSNRSFTPIGQALGWLQKHSREHPPIIIAPKHKPGQAITRFVPNNDGDKKFDRQDRLTAKHTQPTLFLIEPGQKPEVHYAWPVDGVKDCPVADIEKAARSLTTLGWGIDMAFADAQFINQIEFERRFELERDKTPQTKWVFWYPKDRDYPFKDTLRVPTYNDTPGECTLCDLRHCHSTMMNRIEHGKPLKTVDKPKVLDRVLYTSIERPERRPHAVFKLLDENHDPARYPHAKLVHVAGMVRHAAIESLKGKAPRGVADPGEWLNRFVRGKGENTEASHEKLSFVPLPSIGHEHADAMIRNIMLVAPVGCEDQLDFVARYIDGRQLTPETKSNANDDACETDSVPVGLPDSIERFTPPRGKFIDTCYLGSSRVWESVTPVILDGHNDKKDAKTIKLIQTALQRAGIETPCEFTWQSLPFIRHGLSAHKYRLDPSAPDGKRPVGYHFPKHLKDRTVLHVRLTFAHEVPGPLTLGAGRHCGFGLMAAVGDRKER